MPPKEYDAESSVVDVVEDSSRDKYRTSRSERGEKDRDRDRDRDRDWDRDGEKDRTRDREKTRDRDRDRRDRDRDRDRDRERRERDRDRDGARDADRDRDKDRELRHRSSRSSKHRSTAESDLHSSASVRKRRTKDKDRDRDRERRHRDRDGDRERDRSRDRGSVNELDAVSEMTGDVVPELSRSRVTRPYPTFSKEHSRESVVTSREDVSQPARRSDPLTPEATDLGADDAAKRAKPADSGVGRKSSVRKDERPPSPPETNLSEHKDRRRSDTPTSAGSRDREKDRGADDDRPRSRASWVSRSTSKHESKSKVSTKSRASSQATLIHTTFRHPTVESVQGSESRVTSKSRGSSPRSTKRDAAAQDPSDDNLSPESAQDSSPKTPTGTPQFPPPAPMFGNDKAAGAHLRFSEPVEITPAQTPASAFGPPPPPPPPPPIDTVEVPKVNYLAQNGGLPKPVSKDFLDALPRQNGTRPSNPPLSGCETLFAPFFNILDQYQAVLDGQGSVAVATGHKTIARRILDRLDNVFTRDLPEDGCSCVMCEKTGRKTRGLGWGEVLERFKGDNPPWPPFDLAELGSKGIEESAELPPRPDSPVKMDPDISEEFRGHYLRQNKKVKAAVGKWLTSCAETPAPPPQEVDDETLTFAILTSLEYEEQPYFNALLSGSKELQPAVRAPTPMVRKPRQDFLVRTGLALQRYYGLQQVPRDAETVVYLVRNHHMHDLLRTVSDINPSEWELLVSGRFDGFLWSGADGSGTVGEDGVVTPTAMGLDMSSSGFFSPLPRGQAMSPSSPAPGSLPIRSFTPGGGYPSSSSRPQPPFSRGQTPASFVSGVSSMAGVVVPPGMGGGGGKTAVTMDEELEVQVLSEVERHIYQGMEALENAFEALHLRAEQVRGALRQRTTGLQMGLQRKRAGGGLQSGQSNSLGDGVTVDGRSSNQSGNGASGHDEFSASFAAASESDWCPEDYGELKPDDSASNISSSRHRRPKRRNERRTPAPIEEDYEEE